MNVALLLSKTDDYFLDSGRVIVKFLRLISQSQKLLGANSDSLNSFKYIDETICKTQFVSSDFYYFKRFRQCRLVK